MRPIDQRIIEAYHASVRSTLAPPTDVFLGKKEVDALDRLASEYKARGYMRIAKPKTIMGMHIHEVKAETLIGIGWASSQPAVGIEESIQADTALEPPIETAKVPSMRRQTITSSCQVCGAIIPSVILLYGVKAFTACPHCAAIVGVETELVQPKAANSEGQPV